MRPGGTGDRRAVTDAPAAPDKRFGRSERNVKHKRHARVIIYSVIRARRRVPWLYATRPSSSPADVGRRDVTAASRTSD